MMLFMKHDPSIKDGLSRRIIVVLYMISLFLFIPAIAGADMWVTAYYAGWMQGCSSAGNDGYLKAQDIDYTALTHVIQFAVEPYPDGTLNTDINCISSGNSAALVQAAHAAGKKAIISVGGWDTETDFLSATSSAHRAAFINNLVAFVTSRGYDGLDIDWEPLSSTSAPQYISFITELRTAMNALSPRPLLTAAVIWEPSLFSQLQSFFDQINVMTYEMSGPWPGWITWHNSPLYDGSCLFPSTGAPVPSASSMLGDFIAAGVQPVKLGVGMEFYGALWEGGTGTPTGGVTAPEQSWVAAPTVQMVPYYQIMDTYYQSQNYNWDATASQAYLSINNSGSSQDMFISYDNENSCAEKVNFARAKGLGGVMIFELGGCWRPNQPVRDSLLQAVKTAVGAPVSLPVSAPATPPVVVAATLTNNARPNWTWTTGGGGNGTFRYRLDNSDLTTGATTTTLKSFTPATALANGSHTLYVQEQNSAGRWSANGSQTVLIDTVLPTNGTVTATSGTRQIKLNWKGFSDALSGISGYRLVYATGSAPTSCSKGTLLYTGTGTTYTHTGLSKQIYYYRVCAVDKAGNISKGTTKSARPL